MRTRAELWLAIGALLMAGGLGIFVFGQRVEKGDSSPPYSSWRADALGTAALYEAMPAMGLEVRRLTRVDPDLRAGMPAPADGVILRLGERARYASATRADLRGVLEFAREGGLVLVAYSTLARWAGDDGYDDDGEDAEEGAADPASGTAQSLSGDAKVLGTAPQGLSPSAQGLSGTAAALSQTAKDCDCPRYGLWLPGLDFDDDTLWQRWAAVEPALAGLPKRLAVRGPGSFKALQPSWRPLYAHAGGPVAVTRRYGKGRLIVLADAYPFSNEGLKEERPGALLAALLKGRRVAVFDERGLGLFESPSLQELGWRLGLGPLYGVLILLALLWLWRQLTPLVARPDRLDAAGPVAASAQLGSLLRGQGSPSALLERLWRDAQARPEAPLKRRQAAARLYHAWELEGKPAQRARAVYLAMTEILSKGEQHG